MLGESVELVRRFFLSQFNADGGCRNRAGISDLYYTGFVLQGLAALDTPLPEVPLAAFLESFGHGAGLDLVHLASWVRGYSLLRGEASERSVLSGPGVASSVTDNAGFLRRLEDFRARDGGYAPNPRAATGTLYGLYLAKGIHEDLGLSLARDGTYAGLIRRLELADGGWANEAGIPAAATTVGAAAVSVLRHLDEPVPPGAAAWFLSQRHPRGGFRANRAAPVPDLLSTATALHALKEMGQDLGSVREPCLDFVDSLWTNEGGFHGHWADDVLDSEYTFYGLLALGCLAR